MNEESAQTPGVPVVTRDTAEKALGIPAGLPATYAAAVRLLDWGQGGRQGMYVDLRCLFPGPSGGHPFRGMSTGKERGQRFMILVSLPRPPEGGDPPAVYSGEALLLKWSESDTSGMMVRFLLDDGPDGVRGHHPFFGYSIGRTAGEPMDLSAWGLRDDERAVGPSKLRKKVPWHQMTEVQQSQILSRDPRFRSFLMDNLPRLVPDETARAEVLSMAGKPEMFAAAAIRSALGVSSRAVMNLDTAVGLAARARWHVIMGQYDDELWGRRS